MTFAKLWDRITGHEADLAAAKISTLEEVLERLRESHREAFQKATLERDCAVGEASRLRHQIATTAKENFQRGADFKEFFREAIDANYAVVAKKVRRKAR